MDNNIKECNNRGSGWKYTMDWGDKWNLEVRFIAPSCTQITPNWLWILLMSSLWNFSSIHHIPTKPWPLNGANYPLEALTRSEESCCRKQTCQSWSKYTVEYGNILDQQSIYGINVSLILCMCTLSHHQLNTQVINDVSWIHWLTVTYNIHALSTLPMLPF